MRPVIRNICAVLLIGMLRGGDWFSASRLFEELAGRFPESKNLDLFVFNRAKAEYYLGEYNQAVAGFSFFIRRFPQSEQLAHAYFFRGNAYYRNGAINVAIRSYLSAYEIVQDKRLEKLILAALEAMIDAAGSVSLRPADFESIPQPRKCTAIEKLGAVLARRGEIGVAQELLAVCNLVVDKDDRERFRINRLKDEFEIGLVLPFSGDLHAYAQEIYNGATIAAELFRRDHDRKIKLISFDTRGDPIDAARIVIDLARGLTVDAAIGPLTSEEAAVVSAGLSCGDLPLIIPAATQAGLTQLSPTTFQLSPNIELQGIRMADYAIDKLGANTAVVITPTSSDYLRMSNAFIRRFEQLGGTVVAVEYYRSRDSDFGKILRDIKAMILGNQPDSLFVINADGDTLHADEIQVHFDCMFLPGDAQQLRLLIPQINFYSFDASFLGSDGWGDEAVLKLGDKTTKGAVFASPFLSSGNSTEYFEYASMHDARFGKPPTRLSNLGFDAVRLICRALADGGFVASEIIPRLSRITDYDGASGKISFGNLRENVFMPLYRIELEQAIPLYRTQPPDPSDF